MSQTRNAPPNRGGLFSGLPALPLIGAAASALLLGAVLLVATACGGGGGGGAKKTEDSPHAGLAADTAPPTVEATIDLSNRQTVVPTVNPNLTNLGTADKMIVTRFGVEAPLKLKTVGLDGQMPDPDNPDDVVLYDFSQWPGLGGGPGKGGNAVFAGHVDSGKKPCKNGTVKPPCEAVFWDMRNLKNGDQIELRIGGESFKYTVTSNQPVSATNGPWEKIVSSTTDETITLITCGGEFKAGEYNNRQVVTATRLKA